jgi:hypothetical protein
MGYLALAWWAVSELCRQAPISCGTGVVLSHLPSVYRRYCRAAEGAASHCVAVKGPSNRAKELPLLSLPLTRNREDEFTIRSSLGIAHPFIVSPRSHLTAAT